MELNDLISEAVGFDQFAAIDKIRVLAWFLHNHRSKENFVAADIKSCFDQLHLTQINISMYLARMTDRSPPDLIRARGGYKLSRQARTDLDAKYGTHQSVVRTSKILTDLPGRVRDLAEKHFLSEAVSCYRAGAYRACIVMTWNLAFSHLVAWIVGDSERLAKFNNAISRRYPKKTSTNLQSYNDFLAELKESEVIEVCNTSGIISGNLVRILREKLDKRNNSAHPTSIEIVQSQADDVVTDLVNNVVLALT